MKTSKLKTGFYYPYDWVYKLMGKKGHCIYGSFYVNVRKKK